MVPLQLIDGYYNIIAEALKIKQGTANLSYLTFTLFCAATATLGVFLIWHLAVKLDMFKQIIHQLFHLDEYLMRKYTFVAWIAFTY